MKMMKTRTEYQIEIDYTDYYDLYQREPALMLEESLHVSCLDITWDRKWEICYTKDGVKAIATLYVKD